MYVDVVTTSLSFNALPEDHKFVLYLDQRDLNYATSVLRIFEDLLASYGQCSGEYHMSLYDFFTFRKRLKILNLTQYLYITDKAMAVLKNHLETVKLIAEIKAEKWNDRVPDGILNRTLWPDQKAAVAFHLAHGRSGNFFSVGLGKTAIALYWYGVLRRQGKVRRVIVLCINENKTTWEREIRKHTSWIGETTIVDNGTKQVLADLDSFTDSGDRILICHYDALSGPPRRKDEPKNKQYDPRENEIVQRLVALRPECIICDEAHSLQNLSAKRTKSVFSIFSECEPPHGLFLTATPISESPVNAYSILSLIRPQVLPSKTRFDKHFSNTFLMNVTRRNKKTGKKYRTGAKVPVLSKKNPYKHLDELAELVKIYGFRKRHDEVHGMPKTLDQVVNVALDGPQKALYARIAAETYDEVARMPTKAMNLDMVLVRTLRLRQILSHPALLGEAGESCKFLALDNLVSQHMADPQNKLIIWSAFKDTCNLIVDRYKIYGASPFHGDVAKQDFKRTEDLFLDADYPRILAATPDKAGTGKNLQRARLDIWVDKPVRLLLYEQARGRIERRDAVGTSVHVSIVATGTIDEWVEDLLARKMKVKQQVMDDGGTYVEPVKIDQQQLLQFIRSQAACAS